MITRRDIINAYKISYKEIYTERAPIDDPFYDSMGKIIGKREIISHKIIVSQSENLARCLFTELYPCYTEDIVSIEDLGKAIVSILM